MPLNKETKPNEELNISFVNGMLTIVVYLMPHSSLSKNIILII